MVIEIENTVATHATSKHALEVFNMRFDEEQMKRQAGYSLTLHILQSLHNKGMLNSTEMKEAEKIIADKYKPILRLNS